MSSVFTRNVIVAVLAVMLLGAALTGCGLVADESVDPDLGEGISSDAAVERDMASSQEIAPVPEGGTGEDASKVPAEDRLVIRSVGLRIEVDDVEESVDRIRSLTSSVGGTVQSLQVSTDIDTPLYRYDAQGTLADGAPLAAYMTVRVPAEDLDAFVADASELGRVLRESSGEDDVTQEHIDLGARLSNLQAQEQRLREFFDAATDVEDMLAIEQEITRVRSEIESLQAQIAYLERQAARATVTIELTEPTQVVSPDGESWGFVEAIARGIRGAARVLTFAISFLIATSPLWVLGIVAFFVIRAVLRKRRARSIPAPEVTSTQEGPTQ